MELFVRQDTSRVLLPKQNPALIEDTIPVIKHSVTSDISDTALINQDKSEEIIKVLQKKVPEILVETTPVLDFNYSSNHFFEGYQHPGFQSLIPFAEEDTMPWEIAPVPVFENDNPEAMRQNGQNYLIYLKKSENRIEQKANVQVFPNWTLYLVLFSFFTLTVLKMVYTRFFQPLLNAAFSHKETLALYSNRNSITQNTFLILQFLFSLNGGFFLYLTGSYFNILPNIPDYYTLIILSAGVFLLYQLKFILLYILGFFFNQIKAFVEYIHTISLYNKLLGVLLIPVTAGMVIMSEHLTATFIYIGLGLIILSYIIRLIRGAGIILDKGFSVFYMFLYLCALEILPVMIVYKLLQL